MLEICCSSISGGYFVSQMAIMTILMEVRSKSKIIDKHFLDLYFGASGGALTNMISTCFEETKESIERLLYSLQSEIFVKNWWKGKIKFLDSKIFYLFKNSFFESSDNIFDVVSELTSNNQFNNSDSPELWTLTFNINKSKPTIFCSKKKDHSLFKDSMNIENNFVNFEYVFLEGNLEKISKTVMASASVPGVKEGVEINNDSHVDGGVSNPTPYIYFSKILYSKNKNKEISRPYHYYYLLPHGKKETNEEKVSNSIADAFLNNLSFSVFNDREFVFNSWLKLIDTEEDKLEKIKIQNIKKKNLLDLLEKFHSLDYFITFYADCIPINITKFNGDDLENCFHESYNNINLEMFVIKNLI